MYDVKCSQMTKIVLEIFSVQCQRHDFLHFVINFEMGYGRKRTIGSSLLRRLMHKFNQVDAAMVGQLGDWFDGENPMPHSLAEARLYKMIGSCNVQRKRALAVISKIRDTAPWKCRMDFMEALAALTSVYKKQMHRRIRLGGRQVRYLCVLS